MELYRRGGDVLVHGSRRRVGQLVVRHVEVPHVGRVLQELETSVEVVVGGVERIHRLEVTHSSAEV